MAVLVLTTSYQTVTPTYDELWQVLKGRVLLSSDATPDADDEVMTLPTGVFIGPMAAGVAYKVKSLDGAKVARVKLSA